MPAPVTPPRPFPKVPHAWTATPHHDAASRLSRRVIPYVAAVAAVSIAVFARLMLAPQVGTELPFITLFPMVFVVAFFFGLGPAVVATLIGLLAALQFFLAPAGRWLPSGATPTLGALLFTLTGVGIGWLGEARLRAMPRRRRGARAGPHRSGARGGRDDPRRGGGRAGRRGDAARGGGVEARGERIAAIRAADGAASNGSSAAHRRAHRRRRSLARHLHESGRRHTDACSAEADGRSAAMGSPRRGRRRGVRIGLPPHDGRGAGLHGASILSTAQPLAAGDGLPIDRRTDGGAARRIRPRPGAGSHRAARGDRRELRGRDRRQAPRRDDHELERRRGAHLRLLRRGDRGSVHLHAGAPGAARRRA